MTVRENLFVGGYRLSKSERNAQMEHVFEVFQILKERKKQLAVTLSGGELQMLVIGRTIMMKPSLITLDEPSLGLAPLIIEEIKRVINRIKVSPKAILLAEQNVDVVRDLSDKVYVLSHGSLIYSGNTEEVLKNEGLAKTYLGI